MLTTDIFPQFLESISAMLTVILLAIEFVFINYILEKVFDEVKQRLIHCPAFHKAPLTWLRGAWDGIVAAYKVRKAAISCTVFISGDFIIRSTMWFYFHQKTAGRVPPEKFSTAMIALGVIVCIIGGVCILRYFAPRNSKHWHWWIVGVIASSFIFAMVNVL